MGFALETELEQDDLDRLLAKLNSRYEALSAAAGAARAEYWTLRHEPEAPVVELEQTGHQWLRLERRRHEIAGQIEQISA